MSQQKIQKQAPQTKSPKNSPQPSTATFQQPPQQQVITPAKPNVVKEPQFVPAQSQYQPPPPQQASYYKPYLPVTQPSIIGSPYQNYSQPYVTSVCQPYVFPAQPTQVIQLQPQVSRIAYEPKSSEPVSETKIVTIQQRPQDNSEMLRKLDELERIHINEVRDLESRLEHQLQSILGQRRAEDQAKEIEQLKHLINELKIAKPEVQSTPQQVRVQQQMQPTLSNHELDEARQKINRIKEKNNSLQQQLQTLKSQSDQKDFKILDLTRKIDHAEQNLKNQDIQNNKDINELKKISDEQRKNLESKDQENKELKKQIDYLKDELRKKPQVVEKIIEVPVIQPPMVQELVREVPMNDSSEVGSVRRERDQLRDQLNLSQRRLDLNAQECENMLKDMRALEQENHQLRQLLTKQDQYIQGVDRHYKFYGQHYQSSPTLSEPYRPFARTGESTRDPRTVSFQQ